MEWWVWLVVSLVLLLLELATPGGFYFVFFGVSALLVGVLTALGITTTDWVEWLLFSAFAIVATALFRRPLLKRFGADLPGVEVDTLVGETAMLLEEIQPGGLGKGELRGTSWNVCNQGRDELRRGQRCRVQRVDGLTLFVNGTESTGASH